MKGTLKAGTANYRAFIHYYISPSTSPVNYLYSSSASYTTITQTFNVNKGDIITFTMGGSTTVYCNSLKLYADLGERTANQYGITIL